MTLVWEKPPKASLMHRRRAGGGYSKLAELAYLKSKWTNGLWKGVLVILFFQKTLALALS
eukprot:8248815-Prorocentrum_lima.AAC.1